MLMNLTAKRLRQVVDYDPQTGIFVARIRRGKITPGKIVGVIEENKKKKYKRLKFAIDGKYYFSHRLAWLWVHGSWPERDLDHINRDTFDNRLCNLRLATNSQNMANARMPITNKSGKKGVSWHARGMKWQAHVKVRCISRYLGLFNTVEEAHASYCQAAKTFQGEFARSE